MFTGIIKEAGFIKGKKKQPFGFSMSIKSKKLRPKIGDSIAINGVCLTVTQKFSGGFKVDIIKETLKRTNLGGLDSSSRINLEPGLKLGEKLNGHFVTGHVDAVCKITIVNKHELTVELPKKLHPFVAEKGSIAINGVSLTITNVSGGNFSVALIPHTFNNTNLGYLKKGSLVNIEVDVLSRYAYNAVKSLIK